MSPKMFKNLSGHTDKKPSYIFLKNPYMGKAQFEIGDLRQK